MGDEAITRLARAAYRLSAADSRLRGRATRSAEALSLAHARALKSLAEHGPMTVNQLAGHVETTGAAVTQLVNGLANAGYVTRERAASGDRRTSIVALTDAGRRRHEEREQVLAAGLRELTEDLDEQAIDAAGTVLTRLADLYDRL
ncbi:MULTISPECIES: MarR family transcriptional regulator [unclassified Amycolatopsis]|uniref:MarR family winged helix-turn-helix transcriptional regulator n=1 Tax=unclassified Amycolatopsis TaxID=2618356 RepID=UPI000569101A|nr:MarR family transcriptional regulator [Amycolatopsis sp. La24]